jgi:transcriptional/translational regulatory protein YebC/TACO1
MVSESKKYSKSLTRECHWTERGDYDTVVVQAVTELRNKLLRRVRERLMNGGSDLGGPGVVAFDKAFYEAVSVQISVSSRVSLERFIQSLSKPTRQES